MRCVACPAGRFAALSGTAECGVCTAGDACAQGAVTPAPCAPGSYSSAGLVECIACPPARFAAAARATRCEACLAGHYCPRNGTSSPTPCSAGSVFCVAGLSAPSPILDGAFKVSDSSSASCAPGSECQQGVSRLCAAGRYATLPASSLCLPCLEGRFASAEGSVTCAGCLPGKAQPAIGGTVCERCRIGFYSPQPSAPNCMPCGDGTFSAPQQSACFDCPSDGMQCAGGFAQLLDNWWFDARRDDSELAFGEATALYECVSPGACITNATSFVVHCRAGHRGVLCGACEAGFVMEPEGCRDCAGSATSPGAIVALVLLILLFWLAVSLVVLHRPDNSFRWMSAKKMAMRWRRRIATLREANARAEMRKRLGMEAPTCPTAAASSKEQKSEETSSSDSVAKQGEATSSSDAAATTRCAGGADAPSRRGENADDEEEGRGGVLTDVLVVADTPGVLANCVSSMDASALIEKCRCALDEIASLKSKVMGQVKLLLGFLQIAGGISMTFNVPWDKSIVVFLATLQRFQFALSDVLSLVSPCALETTFYENFLGTVLVIPACAATLLVAVLASLATSALRRPVGALVAPRAPAGAPVGARRNCAAARGVARTLATPWLASRHTSRSIRTRASKLLSWICFVLYPSICAKSFALWKCDAVDSAWYLREDFRVRCFEGRWIGYAIASIASMALYVVGIPVLSLAILVRAKRAGSLFPTTGHHPADIKTFERHRRMKNKYGGLYMQYDPACWWFEIVVMFEKMVLTGALVLVADGSATQILLGLLVCFIFLLLLGNLKPYPERRDDVLAQSAQIQLFLTLLAALIVKVQVGGVYEAELFSWCVIAANCATIALALFIMLSNLPCTACIADGTCVRRAWARRRCAVGEAEDDEAGDEAGGEAVGEAVGEEAVGDVELVDIVICDELSGPAPGNAVLAARRRRRSSLGNVGGAATGVAA